MWTTLLLLAVVVRGEINIVGTSGNSSLVKSGSTTTMTCQADRQWFLCLWTSPRGDRQCAIQEGQGTTTSVCQGDSRVELEGDSTTCTIRVRGTQQEDQGDWMCLLQDGQQFLTDRRTLGLEVAHPGVLVMLVDGRRVKEGESVILTEGETVGVVCRLEDAFPRPIFSWTGPRDGGRMGREVGRVEEVVEQVVTQEDKFSEDDHSFISSSNLQYTATVEDTNSSISCRVKQRDDQGGILYSQQAAVTLDVTRPPPPAAPATSSRAGVILGSSLAAILVLLLAVILAVVLCRDRRKKRGPSPPPAASAPAVWTTHVEEHPTELHLNSTFDTSSLPEYSELSPSCSSSSQPSDLGTLPCLQETHFPSTELQLATRSLGSPSHQSLREAGISSRPASTLGVSLHPFTLHPFSLSPTGQGSVGPTPPCPGSRASVFQCQHDCFNDSLDHHHPPGGWGGPLPLFTRPLSPTAV